MARRSLSILHNLTMISCKSQEYHTRSCISNLMPSSTPLHVGMSRYLSSKSDGSKISHPPAVSSKSQTTESLQEVILELLPPPTTNEATLDEISTKDLSFEDRIYTTIMVYAARRIMKSTMKPKELEFEEIFSKVGYEIFLNVCGFNEADLEVSIESKKVMIMGEKLSPLTSEVIGISKTHVVSNLVFIDPEDGMACVVDGQLKISFALIESGDEAVMKVGKFPIKWVKV